MQKNKINFSKKIMGLGVTAAVVLCQHPASAQSSQKVTKEQAENFLRGVSATITNSNGTKTTLHIPAEVIPDLFPQMAAAQKYCDDLIRSGVPEKEAIKQMQIAVFSGEFDGNKTGNAAPTDDCNIV